MRRWIFMIMVFALLGLGGSASAEERILPSEEFPLARLLSVSGYILRRTGRSRM